MAIANATPASVRPTYGLEIDGQWFELSIVCDADAEDRDQLRRTGHQLQRGALEVAGLVQEKAAAGSEIRGIQGMTRGIHVLLGLAGVFESAAQDLDRSLA